MAEQIAAPQVTIEVDGKPYGYDLGWAEVASLFAAGRLRPINQRSSRSVSSNGHDPVRIQPKRRKSGPKVRVPFPQIREWGQTSDGKKALKAAGLDPAELIDGSHLVGVVANRFREVFEQAS